MPYNSVFFDKDNIALYNLCVLHGIPKQLERLAVCCVHFVLSFDLASCVVALCPTDVIVLSDTPIGFNRDSRENHKFTPKRCVSPMKTQGKIFYELSLD